jgi:Zn-dependent M28 family amino/carboxypeptidase
MKRTCIGVLVAASLAIGWRQRPADQAPKSNVIDAAALLNDLKVLSADEMQGRQVDTEGGAKARAYVIQRFKDSGIKPFGESYEMPFTFQAGRGGNTPERHGVNVVGYIDGQADLKVRPTNTPSQTYVVVSAHYDHIGVRNGVVFNGADDNASGTAALFAVAKYFSAHKPTHSIIFVAFDGEESGLRGANAFVAKPPVDASAIVVDVNMDMIGRDPDDKLFAVGTRVNPFLKPYLEKVAAAAPVKLLFGHEDPAQKDVEDWSRDSDHYAFQRQNIPAIYLGVEDFGQHHKATDDYETITYSFYVRAVETCVSVVKAFDANLDAIAKKGGRP